MNNEPRQFQPREKVSGLWKRTTKDGKKFISGIDEQGVRWSIWTNSYKQAGDSKPDCQLWRELPQDATAAATTEPEPSENALDEILF